MGKRRAEKELTKDTVDLVDDEYEEPRDTPPARADSATLEGRTFKHFKRPASQGNRSSLAPSSNPFKGISLTPSPFQPPPPDKPLTGVPNPFAASFPPVGNGGGPAPALLSGAGGALPGGAGGGTSAAALRQLKDGAGALATDDRRALSRALNKDFVDFLRAEWGRSSDGDWSRALREYLQFRRDISGRSSAPGTTLPAQGTGAAPLFAPLGGPAAGAAPTPKTSLPKPAPAIPPSSEAGGAPPPGSGAGAGAGDGAVGAPVLEQEAKLSVLRKTDDGLGWNSIGAGQVRVLQSGGTSFLEFRPEVKESKAGNDDPQSDVEEGSARLRAPVLSARLIPDLTKSVELAGKRMQVARVSLMNAIGGGQPKLDKYAFTFKGGEQATRFKNAILNS